MFPWPTNGHMSAVDGTYSTFKRLGSIDLYLAAARSRNVVGNFTYSLNSVSRMACATLLTAQLTED